MLLLVLPLHLASAQDGMPRYVPNTEVGGTLHIVGSETLANLLFSWDKQFRRFHPDAVVEIEAYGSAAAPPALLQGTADLGAMSRRMTTAEVSRFRDRYDYPPVELTVAMDAIGIYVHRSNPLRSISMHQLRGIFSRTQDCPDTDALDYWHELDLEQAWQDLKISAYGRDAASGTYAVFGRQILCGDLYRTGVNEIPGSAGVLRAVAAGIGHIGYSAVSYNNPYIKLLPISSDAGEPVAASQPNIQSGVYPLSRPLFLYLNQSADKPLPPAIRAFLEMILSSDGQGSVTRAGYTPLPESIVLQQRETLARLEPEPALSNSR